MKYSCTLVFRSRYPGCCVRVVKENDSKSFGVTRTGSNPVDSVLQKHPAGGAIISSCLPGTLRQTWEDSGKDRHSTAFERLRQQKPIGRRGSAANEHAVWWEMQLTVMDGASFAQNWVSCSLTLKWREDGQIALLQPAVSARDCFLHHVFVMRVILSPEALDSGARSVNHTPMQVP